MNAHITAAGLVAMGLLSEQLAELAAHWWQRLRPA